MLISDGVPTEGNLSAALDQLSARHIPVDVLPVQYQYEHEVWLEKLELPRTVKAGETYEAAIILSSLQPGSGTLTLKENDNLIFKQDVQFAAGKNRYVLPLYLREPGYYEYVARIEVPPGMDGWPQNNIAINHLYLKGEGKVLLVTDPARRRARLGTPGPIAEAEPPRGRPAAGLRFPRGIPFPCCRTTASSSRTSPRTPSTRCSFRR